MSYKPILIQKPFQNNKNPANATQDFFAKKSHTHPKTIKTSKIFKAISQINECTTSHHLDIDKIILCFQPTINPILFSSHSYKFVQPMRKESLLDQKLLICLVLMIVGTYAGRICGYMEPNCHKYRPDGSCECCSFRFWMTSEGRCQQVSNQCRDWCRMTGKCTCCYLGYVLENGCCVLPCQKPAPKCEEPPKKCVKPPVQICEDSSKECVKPVKKWQGPSRRWEGPSRRWVEPVKKYCAPEKPPVQICHEPQSCKSEKSCESSEQSKSCESSKKSKQQKSNKSNQCNGSKNQKLEKLQSKIFKRLKKYEKAGRNERRSVMNKSWMGGASKNNLWNKPAGVRVNYKN